MGTRGGIGVRAKCKSSWNVMPDRDVLFVTYNHYDSDPESLGQDIVNFCLETLDSDENIEIFKQRFNNISMVDLDCTPSKSMQDRYMKEGFCNDSVGEQTPKDWYCLLRNLQGVDYLKAVFDNKCIHWIDSSNFLKDSLFCEYAYIIDLEKKKLEFYKGYNTSPDKKSPLPFPQEPDKEGFYPVCFMGSVPINKIPKNWIEKFYKEKIEK